MKLHKEKWINNKGDREDHYYVDKGRKIYVFGFNPRVIRKYPRIIFDIIRLILKSVDNL